MEGLLRAQNAPNSGPASMSLKNVQRTFIRKGVARLKRDGTRAETRFGLSAKRTSPFKLAVGGSVQSTTGSRGVRISGSNGSNHRLSSSSNAGYTTF